MAGPISNAVRQVIVSLARYQDDRAPPPARAPVLPKRAPVSLVLLRPLYFDGQLVEVGTMVEVDGYDAPTMIARGVARAV